VVKVIPAEPAPVKPAPERHKPKPAPIAAAPKEHPKPAPPPEDEPVQVPAGEGRLRIGTIPASVVSRIVVGRDDWGPGPVDRKVSSGTYAVSVRMENGKKSAVWRGAVMPDRTTMLVYDIGNERWQVK